LAAVEPDVARALTRAEQEALSALPAGAAAPSKPAVVFKTVDYELSGAGSGTVTITGTSEPRAAIVLYYGKERVAEARADGSGNWRVQVAKTLGMGQHSFRAERAGAPAGTTVAAVISIERAEPQPAPSPSAPEVAARGAVPQVALTNGQASGTVAKEIYTIRRGDTLWAIAKRYLGSGLRYTAIFQDNRGIISNPNLIHPQQEVSIPNP
jgi:nucleoid-associated protein YgaU